MPRIMLNSDPYELTLFCPFCGHQVLSAEEEEGLVDPCEHLVRCGIDDPSESDLKESDVVFVCFESAHASRDHVFAFREPYAQPFAPIPTLPSL